MLSHQGFFYFKNYLHSILSVPKPSSLIRLSQSVVDLLIHQTSFWLCGLFAGLSLFVQERRRRGELAVYVLSKGLGSA
jgi:hypothetical protein